MRCPLRKPAHRERATRSACLIDVRHRNILLGELALTLGGLSLLVLALEDRLAVLVKLELGDDALRGVDANLHGGTCVTGEHGARQIRRRVRA